MQVQWSIGSQCAEGARSKGKGYIMSHITMDQELTEAHAKAIQAVRDINDAIKKLRSLKISTTLREHDGYYFLDARAALQRPVAEMTHGDSA